MGKISGGKGKGPSLPNRVGGGEGAAALQEKIIGPKGEKAIHSKKIGQRLKKNRDQSSLKGSSDEEKRRRGGVTPSGRRSILIYCLNEKNSPGSGVKEKEAIGAEGEL